MTKGADKPTILIVDDVPDNITVLSSILSGEQTGTFFIPRRSRLQARKRWIAYNAKPSGKIIVDNGAKEALLKKNRSLLACGVKAVEGKFIYGDTVVIAGFDGAEFARGLSNYSAEDLDKVKGMSTKWREGPHIVKCPDNRFFFGHL